MEVDAVISELGRRLPANPGTSVREPLDSSERSIARPGSRSRADGPQPEGPGRTAEDLEPDPDFALSLSSASLRLAGAHAEQGLRASRAQIRDPHPSEVSGALAAPSPNHESPEPARPAATNRAIDAYREIARAPLGERVRVVA